MTGRDPSAVVRDVQTLFGAGAVGGLTDGQLLERFVSRRDTAAEAAFTALVERHGPMVWGVCRRSLNDHHAAADAFQATFLVLARKAATVRVDDSLGRWLYGVSRRVARRARIVNSRRSVREGPGVETLAAPSADPDSDRSELLAHLDDEIGRLPKRYRAALVLCDLGSMSHEEAARQLGCAVGTVGSRVARARERLRVRLTRRGLVPMASALGALLSVEAASAAVPAALVGSTARAALQIAAGESALVAANVSALSKGTLNAMMWSRLKVVAALASLAGAGLFVFEFGLASESKAPPVAGKAVAQADRTKPAARTRRAAPTERVIPEIFGKMAETYAVAQSYEDEGEVVTVFTRPDGSTHTTIRPFATKFVRPKFFRFEYWDRTGDGDHDRSHYVIWSDAGPTRCKIWWTLEPEVEEDSLESATGACNGVSGGSAIIVPGFLHGANATSPFNGMHDFQRAGEEAVDEVLCEKIEGKNSMGNPETVWIDKATFLVKKILKKSHVPRAAVEATTTYRPRLNVAIPPEQFTFVPPALPKVPPAAVVPPRTATPPAPAPASSETERRLAEVERKIERILRILEPDTRARPAPKTPADSNEPR